MRSSFIVVFYYLFLAVQSFVIEQKSCVSSDVIAIAQQVSSPHYFCAWYLSEYVVLHAFQKLYANLGIVVGPTHQSLISSRMHCQKHANVSPVQNQ